MSDYTPAVMDFLTSYLDSLRREVLNGQKVQTLVAVIKLVFIGMLSGYVLVEYPPYIRHLVLFLPFLAFCFDLIVLRSMEHGAKIEAYIREHMEHVVQEVDTVLGAGWIGWETYRRGARGRAGGMLTHMVVHWGPTWVLLFACVWVTSWSYDRALLSAYILIGTATFPLAWALFAGAYRYWSSGRIERKGGFRPVLRVALIILVVLGIPVVGGAMLRHSYPFEDLFHKGEAVSMKAIVGLLQKVLLQVVK